MPSTAHSFVPTSRRRFVATSLAALCLLGQAPSAAASDTLSKKYACTTCHQVAKKLVGPSWQAVSEKYSGNLTAEQLAISIKKGGGGKWGAVPMPPQPQVADADLAALAGWILQGGKP